MDIKTHWIFDDFSPDAQAMREKIDHHFDDSKTRDDPFATRAVWNYWFVEKMYTYLRAQPSSIYPELHTGFMEHLKLFVAANYGLAIIYDPFLSMYVSGCGQGLHNDAKNGRLAYVFSLTKWEERHFDGGETIIYRFNDQEQRLEHHLKASAGNAFYDLVEATFNRLIIFDDRVPHAVRPVQGKMDPHDARFVVHGHIEEQDRIEYIAGGLEETDLSSQWQQMKEQAERILDEHGHHGFVTVETEVTPEGAIQNTVIKHAQLLARTSDAKPISASVDDITAMVSKMTWPTAAEQSLLVFALCSPLK